MHLTDSTVMVLILNKYEREVIIMAKCGGSKGKGGRKGKGGKGGCK